MRLWTSELAAACGGRLLGLDVAVDGASFDSRALQPGQLFVPVVAERDGHAFVGAAIDAGAVAYLSSAGAVDARATAVEVADTAEAFLALGRLARERVGERVVGVTGSVGKTTVKDLTAAVLARTFRTTANARSFNNELGLPATLLGAPDGTEAVVVEMGMRGFGEIARLCEVARPTVGVVTIIGEAHIGRVGGTLDGVAQAKGELVEALPPSGTAVLNAEQPFVTSLAARTAARVLTFGCGVGEVRADGVVLDELARPRFTLRTPWGAAEVALGVSGAHNAANAAAAAAVGLTLGVPLAAVAAGLAAATVSSWRMEMRRAPSGALVVNDAYNANPTSVVAALDALAALAGTGRRVAVLGPMAELGDDAAERHRAVAAHARSLDLELITVGTADYGVAPCRDHDAAIAALGDLGAGDAVLVKGSRVAGLEVLAARLVGVEADVH
jgi:UDP-N-acetylmuramoyl-tripeptide--D-alanyl-D-alanine ligase